MPKLIVIIISWNTRDITSNCLRSLFGALEGVDNEVWVVDNCSSDGSADMIKEEFPQVRLIVNEENVGFAKANNQVLKKAVGDYYLLLNSDTVVPQDAIKGLCNFLEKNLWAGAVGPKLKDANGTGQVPFKSLPSLSGEFRNCLCYHFFPFDKIFRAMFDAVHTDLQLIKQAIEVEVLSGACLMIRKEVIEKVGILSDDYFLFSEENDYFYRMHQAGFKGYFLPDVEIVHLGGMSCKKRGYIDSEVDFFKSRMLYFKKFHSHKIMIFKVLYLFFFVWSYLIAKLLKLLKGKGENVYLKVYSRLLQALRQLG